MPHFLQLFVPVPTAEAVLLSLAEVESVNIYELPKLKTGIRELDRLKASNIVIDRETLELIRTFS